MQQPEKNRAIIISGLHDGQSAQEIMEFSAIKRNSTSLLLLQDSPDDFNVLRKAHHSRSNVKGLVLANKICNIMEAHPSRLMLSITTKFGITGSTVRRDYAQGPPQVICHEEGIAQVGGEPG
jgi:hypothetical protein